MEGPGNVTINNVAYPTNLGGISLSLSMRSFWIVYALPYTVNIGRALETVICAFCLAALLLLHAAFTAFHSYLRPNAGDKFCWHYSEAHTNYTCIDQLANLYSVILR